MQRNIVLESPGNDKKLNAQISYDNQSSFDSLDLIEAKLNDDDITRLIIPYIKNNPSINTMQLFDCDFGHECIKAIAKITNVDVLGIFNSRITTDDLRALLSNQHFRRMSLCYDVIAGDDNVNDIKDAVIANTTLEWLTLEIGIVLESPGYNRKLKAQLKLHKDSGTNPCISIEFGVAGAVTDQDINTLIIPYVQKNSSINSLTMSARNDEFVHEGVKEIAEKLHLDLFEIAPGKLISDDLKILLGNRYFRELHLSVNQITDDGNVNDIRNAIIANTSLKVLDLRHSQIGDELAKALAASSHLQELDVSHNHISDEGVKALAANPHLYELDVDLNQIGDEGIKALAANTSLHTLRVMHNPFTDEGAKEIAKNTTLRTLYIGGVGGFGLIGAKAIASNASFESLIVDSHCHDSDDKKARDAILFEKDPHKRALYGLEAGVTGEVPSLKRLCLFKVQNQPELDRGRLPSDLQEQLKQWRV